MTRAASPPASRTPTGLAVLAVLGTMFIALPLVALLQRAPWSDLPGQLTDHAVLEALRLSLVCSAGALAASTLLGVPLAWMLARVEFRGRTLLRALVTLPMVLPPVVGGVALLLAAGRRGLLGGLLAHAGVSLPFTTPGVIVAETFVAMPFLVVAVEAGLRSADIRYEEAAASLGATPWYRFRRVTMPMVAPSLAAGAALTWARALGEFGATITFAGNFPGTTRTMPSAIYGALQSQPDAAVVLSIVLLAVSLSVLVLLRGRWLGIR